MPNSKNLDPSVKQTTLSALTAAPTKTKDMAEVYRELNTQSNNTTQEDKERINRAQIG